MSHTFNITVTDTEYKGLQSSAVSPQTWIENAATNEARIENDKIISALVIHCNENNIAIAVGRDAQVTQAFSLGIAKTAEQRQKEFEDNWKASGG